MPPKLLVHTDVIADHLTTGRGPSLLRRAAGSALCYTTVLQAASLFAMARTTAEQRAVEECLGAFKILGINARQARAYGRLLARHPRLDPADVLAAALCLDARLPLLTGRPGLFRGIRGLRLVSGRRAGSPRRRGVRA
jgi:predicted nucleic acid-binding protein